MDHFVRTLFIEGLVTNFNKIISIKNKVLDKNCANKSLYNIKCSVLLKPGFVFQPNTSLQSKMTQILDRGKEEIARNGWVVPGRFPLCERGDI